MVLGLVSGNLGGFGRDFECDFFIQNLIVVRIHFFSKSSEIIGFYNGFCTLSHIVM